MRRFRLFTLAFSILGLLVALTPPVHSGGSPDGAVNQASPLSFVPDKADLILQIENPRKFVETGIQAELFQEALNLEAFKEAYQLTNVKRFYQMVAYYEKELGGNWHDLLDQLAGDGIVVALKFGNNPPPYLVVVQGKDEAKVKKFWKLASVILEQELARQEGKDRPERGKYRDLETIHQGKDFYLAQAGSAIVFSNHEAAFHKALDQFKDGGKGSVIANPALAERLKEGRKLLPDNTLAWAWLNLDSARENQQVKSLFELPRDVTEFTVFAAGTFDVIGRSPFVCAGLVPSKDGAVLTIRALRGREGMPAVLATHVPPLDKDGHSQGALPILEPKRVMFSSSYYLDMSKFWTERTKLFRDKQIKVFEEFDQGSGKFLAGARFSELLQQAGTHQRFVIAHQQKPAYKKEPDQRLPAFAVVLDMREPKKFSRSVKTALCSAGLLSGIAGLKLQLVEETHNDIKLVGYRFPEDENVAGDVANIRFNFTPCFAAVGDQFMVASTMDLGKELVGMLQQEAKAKPQLSKAASRTRIYSSGVAEFLQAGEDQLFTQTVLDRGLPPFPLDKLPPDIKAFVDLVRKLGVVKIETMYNEKDFRYDIRYVQTKK